MKVQNCPLCYSRGNPRENGGGIWVICTNKYCDFSMPTTLEIWNRIRIAPDDKKVVSSFIGHEEHGITEHQDWMNPNYPKGEECFECGEVKELAYCLNVLSTKRNKGGMEDFCQECAELLNKGPLPENLHPLLGKKIT